MQISSHSAIPTNPFHHRPPGQAGHAPRQAEPAAAAQSSKANETANHGRQPRTAETDKKAETDKRDETQQPGAQRTGQELSQDELRQVQELKQRDREVRAHEAAHQAAAGGLAKGGASFSYDRGPDGRLYAVGGEVSIDTGRVAGDPEATLRKAQQVQAAALAPAQPSAQDRAVAAQAATMAAEARSEMMARQQEQNAAAPDANENSARGEKRDDGRAAAQSYREVANQRADDSRAHQLHLTA